MRVTTPSAYRVFLASPSDAADERAIARDCIEEVNVALASSGQPTFDLVGWEIVRGTAQRPQEAINELIDSCDYMLCIFRREWGSDPGGASGYTSGTEEELFTALRGLARRDHPMRDVWIAFMDVSDVCDEVSDLKKQIRDRHAVLYESPNDASDFRAKVTMRLHGWARAKKKGTLEVDLLPRSGRDVLRADRLSRRGEQLVELGQPEVGEAMLKEAVEVGAAPEKITYGRFLGRQGRIAEAQVMVQSAVDELVRESPTLASPSVAEAYAQQAHLLRRERKNFEAKQRLAQALDLLQSDDEYTRRVRCRILDDIGLAHHATRDYDEAIECFHESREIRLSGGDEYLVAQSEINLSRAYLGRGDVDDAGKWADAAIGRLRPLTPRPVHANSYLLRAQLSLRDGKFDTAVESAKMSLALNEQMCNLRGTAIAHNVLAQAYQLDGDERSAEHHARACVRINAKMGTDSPSTTLRILAEAADVAGG